MLKYIVMNIRIHIRDMFDEMFVMVSKGPVKSMFKYLHLYLCFNVTFHFWKIHEVSRSGLRPSPEKLE